MKFSKWIVLMLVVIAVVITCVACGGNENETTTTTTTQKGGDGPDVPDCGDNHTYEWTVTAEPTCERKGTREGVCTVCGATTSERMDKIDHAWGEDLTREATCLATGEVYHVCASCDAEEQIEELPLVGHEFTTVDDATGVCTLYSCEECGTSFVKMKESAKDIIYWAGNEVGFADISVWNDDFTISETGFDPYDLETGNVVIAMNPNAINSGLMITDKNNSILKYEDEIILQLDIMFDEYPDVQNQALLTIQHSGQYVNLVSITKEGYIGFVDERVYEQPIVGTKLELGTWYNIAVVVDLKNIYDDGSYGLRLPYDIYLDGQKLTLETSVNGEPYTADRGAAGWSSDNTLTLDAATSFAIRICDYGRSGGTGTYHCSLDNIRIYRGTEVQAAVRGEYDFNGEKVTVDYPAELDWTDKDYV